MRHSTSTGVEQKYDFSASARYVAGGFERMDGKRYADPERAFVAGWGGREFQLEYLSIDDKVTYASPDLQQAAQLIQHAIELHQRRERGEWRRVALVNSGLEGEPSKSFTTTESGWRIRWRPQQRERLYAAVDVTIRVLRPNGDVVGQPSLRWLGEPELTLGTGQSAGTYAIELLFESERPLPDMDWTAIIEE